MINRKVFGHLILIITCFTCCMGHTQQKKNLQWYEFINKNYARNKANFDAGFIDHFPKDLYEIDDLRITMIGDKPGLECVTFMIGVVYDSLRYDSIATLTKKNSIESYSRNDSIFLIYDRYVNNDNLGFKTRLSLREKAELKQASDKGRLPIPNFHGYLESENHTEYNLPNDFEVFVLEAKSGKFGNENYLMERDLMPEEWKHGLSKGIALSEKRKEVIYWFILW